MMVMEVWLLVESAYVATKKAVGGFFRFWVIWGRWGRWGRLTDLSSPVRELRAHVQDQLTEDTRRAG